ncbi:MAG: Uma2 family endonuclease [Pyrinomonadaceae bacterium]|nr:Uma2 family endonuclease [Pyrinomonadaceae bacterium]
MMVTKELREVMTKVRPMPLHYTVDDLDLLPDDENKRYEIIGGKLFVSRAGHLDHQLLATNFMRAFLSYLDENPIGIFVQTPGVIFAKDEAVIPDLVFAANETVETNVAKKGEENNGKFIAAPDLIIEIVSLTRQDAERDRVVKRELYGKYKVKEYWVVDGLFNSIEVYRLNDGETLDLVKRFYIEETITTDILPNFELKLTEIFRF